MPPLVTHMIAACRAGERLGGPADPSGGARPLDRSNGEFMLGATSPDIRVLTRWDRKRTHFFDIASEEHQDCVGAFFDAHRSLRDAGALTRETRDWVCGYLTHLVMDQEYVLSIYRPYFGSRSLLGGDEQANLLDRILQYELDRREREEGDAMREIREGLFASAVDVDAGFLDRGLLEQWRDTSAAVTEHPPDWERFSFIASRHLNRAGIDSEGDLRAFMQRIPELLDDCTRHVEQAALDSFFEATAERTAAALADYLAA